MSSAWAVGSLALAVFIAILTFLVIVIWSIRRHRDPNLTLETECGIDDWPGFVAGIQRTRRQLGAPATRRTGPCLARHA